MNLVIHKKGEPRVSHKHIAKGMNVQSKNAISLIRKYQEQLELFGRLAFETRTLKTKGGNQKVQEVFLNEPQATFLITLMKNTEETVQFKLKLVQAFYQIKQFLESRDIARLEYKPMATAISHAHDPAMPYHYANEADLINSIVIGMTAKKFKELNKVVSVRDNLQPFQLEAIAQLERINTSMIELEQSFEKRKQILHDYFYSKLLKRLER